MEKPSVARAESDTNISFIEWELLVREGGMDFPQYLFQMKKEETHGLVDLNLYSKQ